MAATVVGAMLEAYGALAISPLPTLWFDQLPEGAADSFPNACLEHLGETTNYRARGGQLEMTHRDARLRLHVFNVGFAATDALAQQVRSQLTPDVLAVDGATQTTLTEDNYKLGSSQYRDKNQAAVFTADIDYTARVAFV